MKPNFLIVQGNIFTDLTAGNRNIILIGAYEKLSEAEVALGEIAQNKTVQQTFYIIQFKQELEVFMKPTVRINFNVPDVLAVEESK